MKNFIKKILPNFLLNFIRKIRYKRHEYKQLKILDNIKTDFTYSEKSTKPSNTIINTNYSVPEGLCYNISNNWVDTVKVTPVIQTD